MARRSILKLPVASRAELLHQIESAESAELIALHAPERHILADALDADVLVRARPEGSDAVVIDLTSERGAIVPMPEAGDVVALGLARLRDDAEPRGAREREPDERHDEGSLLGSPWPWVIVGIAAAAAAGLAIGVVASETPTPVVVFRDGSAP